MQQRAEHADPASQTISHPAADEAPSKSTLIGRLLFEANQIFEDSLQSLERESLVHGTTGEEVDFALLVDGLQAEREQGITIDVAYRYFQTDKLERSCLPHRQFVQDR